MIKFASDTMITELKELWLECFEGDDEYCDFFFENYFSCKNCVVHTNDDNDEVEAAAYIFRGEVKINSAVHTVLFLYAGATFKKHRKSGKCSAICQFIADYCKENNIGIIALSTSASSLSLCEKSGMIPNINMRSANFMIDNIIEAPHCQKCSYPEFADMRNQFLNNDFEIYWTDETLKYMYTEIQTSGDIVKTTINNNIYYAAYTVFENELLIRETNCPPDNMYDMINSICAYINYKGKVTVYTNAETELNLKNITSQETFCYAHIWFIDETLNLSDAKWYINLTAE